MEGHQEGTAKGYNPKNLGNPCYNLQFAFCDEIKAFLTGYVRSGDTYTSNGAAGLIQEIIAQVQDMGLKITFRMDSEYFDENILETIESLGFLGRRGDLSIDDDGIQPVLAVQIGSRNESGIPATDQDLPYEVHLPGKIVRTARRVVMKLSKEYPYQEVYEDSLA